MRDKSIQILNYKTKKCKQFFELGYCSYGSRCQFSHKDVENLRTRSNTINSPNSNNRNFSYKNSIDILNDVENIENLDIEINNKNFEKIKEKEKDKYLESQGIRKYLGGNIFEQKEKR